MTQSFEENWLKKGRKDYTESFKLLGKKPILPVPHSSKTAYECWTITSINSDIFSLLAYIMNTVGFSLNCCLFILIYKKKCPQNLSALKVEFSCKRQTMNKQGSAVNVKRLRRWNCSQFQSFPCCLRAITNSPREAICPCTSHPAPAELPPIPPQTFANSWTN